MPQNLWRLHTRGPHHQFRRDKRGISQPQTVRDHFRDPCTDPDLDTHFVKQPQRCPRDAFRQLGQDALCGLDQKNADVALRFDAIESIGNNFSRGAMQLCG
jgi:hypothetical protein